VTPGLSSGWLQRGAPPGWRAVLSAPVKEAYSALDCVLAGMVARGLGIEAICLYLELTQAALLARVVALDLATPHDRRLRKPGGRNPWSVADTRRFIGWWLEGIHPASIGEQLGRSTGGVRAKARRLGLPRRDRKLLVRLPVVDGVAERLAQTLAAGTSTVALGGSLPPVCGVSATVEPPQAQPVPAPGVWATKAAQRRVTRDWTDAERDELATRSWAYQSWRAIGPAMGRSLPSVRSMQSRLGIPRHDRKKLVLTYDPDHGPKTAKRNMEAAGYTSRRCKITNRLFWTRVRGGDWYAPGARKSQQYRDLSAGL
jgi:hypothetical protein